VVAMPTTKAKGLSSAHFGEREANYACHETQELTLIKLSLSSLKPFSMPTTDENSIQSVYSCVQPVNYEDMLELECTCFNPTYFSHSREI